LRLPVGRLAVAIPSGDAANQYALNGAAVEPFEDLGAHALFTTVLMCGPC
jgi:hypothetical protein